VKRQSQYHHRVLTAYKILGYTSSSGKKQPIDVSMNIRILKFIQIWVYGTKPSIQGWKEWIERFMMVQSQLLYG